MKYDERYVTFESRLATFKNWPYTPDQKMEPKEYADAGYTYTGDADRVKCFCCGLVNYGGDSSLVLLPWHTKYKYDTCIYLELMFKERTEARGDMP